VNQALPAVQDAGEYFDAGASASTFPLLFHVDNSTCVAA
jgi:hypothetical protein